jgi:hypothetical protein
MDRLTEDGRKIEGRAMVYQSSSYADRALVNYIVDEKNKTVELYSRNDRLISGAEVFMQENVVGWVVNTDNILTFNSTDYTVVQEMNPDKTRVMKEYAVNRKGEEVVRIYNDTAGVILKDSLGFSEYGSDSYLYRKTGGNYLIVGAPIFRTRIGKVDYEDIVQRMEMSEEETNFFRERYSLGKAWIEITYFAGNIDDWKMNVYDRKKTEDPFDPNSFMQPINVFTEETITVNHVFKIKGKEEIVDGRTWSRFDHEIVEMSDFQEYRNITDIEEISGTGKNLLERYYSDLRTVGINRWEGYDGTVIYQGFDGEHSLPVVEYNSEFLAVYKVERVKGKDRVTEAALYKNLGNDMFRFLYGSQAEEEKFEGVKKSLKRIGWELNKEMLDYYAEVSDANDTWVEFSSFDEENTMAGLSYETADVVKVSDMHMKQPVIRLEKGQNVISIREIIMAEHQELVAGHRSCKQEKGAYHLTQKGRGLGWQNVEEISELNYPEFLTRLKDWYPKLKTVYLYQTEELHYANTGSPVTFTDAFGLHYGFSVAPARITHDNADIGNKGLTVILVKASHIKEKEWFDTFAFGVDESQMNVTLGYEERYLYTIPGDYASTKTYLQGLGTAFDKSYGGMTSEFLRDFIDTQGLNGHEMDVSKRTDYPLGINKYKIKNQATWTYYVVDKGLPSYVFLNEKPSNSPVQIEHTNSTDAGYELDGTPAENSTATNFEIINNTLYKDGRTFLIRGIHSSIYALSSENINTQNRDFYGTANDTYVAGLFSRAADMGVNVVYFDHAPSRGVLDILAANHMYAAIGFEYKGTGPNIKSGTYASYVQKYKDHPAVGWWVIKDEFVPRAAEFGYDANKWFDTQEEVARTIHAADTRHPVSSIYRGDLQLDKNLSREAVSSSVAYDTHGMRLEYGEDITRQFGMAHGWNSKLDEEVRRFPNLANESGYMFLEYEINRSKDYIDFWGINVADWDSLDVAAGRFRNISSEPFYFSGVGVDSYDMFEGRENESVQAKADARMWISDRESNQSLGVIYSTLQDRWIDAGDEGGYQIDE